jgi:hypothetical protein
MKRGEISVSVVISIALILVGVSIIMIFYSQLPWKGLIDRETCHDSVILRASVPDVGKSFLSLKCPTRKICVGKECDEFTNSKEVDKIKVNDKSQIEKLLSEEVVDCWSMMGEGKVSIYSNFLAEKYAVRGVYSSCVICSRIAFDEDEMKKQEIDENQMNEINILNYMLTHKAPNSELSYYESIVGSSPARINIENSLDIPIAVEGESEDGKEVINLEDAPESGSYDETAVLFMQISAPGGSQVLKSTMNSAFGFSVGSFLVAPGTTGMIVGKTLFSNPLTSFVFGVVGVGLQQGMVWNNQNIAAGYCGDVELGDDARDGCSVVRLVKYDNETISSYCGYIESI